jgi:hypothetical protein
MKQINKPGVYEISEERYHQDPVITPSLSRSIAHLLLERSPLHAWTAHPRLNPNYISQDERKFDLGKAAHLAMLGDNKEFAIIQADSFKTFAAQRARKMALAAGQVPVLERDFKRVNAMVQAGRAQLARHEECFSAFIDGKPEQTLIWTEEVDGIEVWCRAMLDWLPDERVRFPDYKSTQGSAHPDMWPAMAYREGMDLQCAFYRRGIRKVLGVDDPIFDFVVQECDPPYALCVISLSPGAIDLADRKIDEALSVWAWCMKRDQWPGYPSRVCYVDPPVWAEKSWLEREDRQHADHASNIERFAWWFNLNKPVNALGKSAKGPIQRVRRKRTKDS